MELLVDQVGIITILCRIRTPTGIVIRVCSCDDLKQYHTDIHVSNILRVQTHSNPLTVKTYFYITFSGNRV